MGRRRRSGNADWTTGGARHHRKAAQEEERAVQESKHNRKYKRGLKGGVAASENEDGRKDEQDVSTAARQVPKRMEDRRPPVELKDLNVRGSVSVDEDIYEPVYAFFKQDRDPKVIVTTAKRPSAETATLADRVLTDFFPNSEYQARQDFSVREIVSEARPLGYTHLLVVGQEKRKKEPDALVVILIGERDEACVTCYFRITSLRTTHKEIHKKGRSTSHYPELILNHFSTGLGKAVGHVFISLFPARPQFTGRQVVTLHNQRDFIFVRRHRYVFDDLPESMESTYGDRAGVGKRTRLQEIGPSFTMRLEAVQRGVFDPHHAIMTAQSSTLSRSLVETPLPAVPKSEIVQAARFKKFLL